MHIQTKICFLVAIVSIGAIEAGIRQAAVDLMGASEADQSRYFDIFLDIAFQTRDSWAFDRYGIDVNFRDENDNTRLHYAVRNGNIDKISFLQRVTDIDMNAHNIDGNTPLIEAALHQQWDVLLYLMQDNRVACGAVNTNNWNALMYTLVYGRRYESQALINRDVQIDDEQFYQLPKKARILYNTLIKND